MACLLDRPATCDQPLQPTATQTNSHEITQSHSETMAVAIAESTPVATGLEPDINF
jgi:hypothetical protein